MTTLVLSHLLPYPADNGAKMRIFNLVRQLQLRDDVVLLVPGPVAELQAQLGPHTEVHRVDWGEAGRPAVGYLHPYPRDVIRPAIAGLRAIDELVARTRAEVIVATDPVLAECVRVFSGLTRVIDIAVENVLYFRRHLPFAPLRERPAWLLRLAKWVAYNRSLADAIDLWIVPGEADRRSLARQLGGGGLKIAVVPNGVDLERNHLHASDDRPPRVVHTGAPSYFPNWDALSWFTSRVWPRVRRVVPSADFVATGAIGNRPLKLPADASVRLVGHLDDVRPVVTSSRAAVVPLRLGVGTRLKIVEALALGTPVVSTTRGAEGLAIIDGEHALIADGAVAFAERVAQVLQSASLRARLAANGRALVEQRYAWDVVGRLWRQAIEGVRPVPSGVGA